jgi:MoaA/NifB/PqqE/SkfB family radical SAM enzyme
MTTNSLLSRIKSNDFMEKFFADKRIPLGMGIELTNRCNYRCIHCYGGYDRGHPDLDKKTILRFIDELCDAGCVGIEFTGGEVLCREDFLEIYIYTRLKGIVVSVLSNASKLTQTHVDVFREYPLALFSTTMYGHTEKTFEAVTSLKGSYRSFMESLKLLTKNEIPIEVKSVALRENKHEILDIERFATKELRVPFRYSDMLRAGNDGELGVLQHRLTAKEAFWFDQNDKMRVDYWTKTAQDSTIKPHNAERRACGKKYFCRAGDQNAFISYKGILHICEGERTFGYDLINGSFSEGWDYISGVKDCDAPKEYPCLTCEDYRYCEQCAAEICVENYSFGEHPKCKLARMRHEWCDSMALELDTNRKGA